MKLKARGAKQMDRAFVGRDSEAEELQVARSFGSTVVDTRGRKYIDFYVGWCVGNLGWEHPEIRSRLRAFRGPTYVAPGCLYAPWAELAERLADLAPGGLRKSWRATGGTEAVEIALQAAMVATGRKKFLAVANSYHGNSIGTTSVAGSEHLPGRLAGCAQLDLPLDERALDKAATILKKRETAAFIMEPIIINLGVLAPTDEFMNGMQELCRKHGTLFIADEVATGFGRTGKLFASEHFDLEPDIMCLGKALTAGHAAIGATIMTEKVARKLKEEELGFWSTYGWHPLSVEAALATLRYFEKHRQALLENVGARSDEFQDRLANMEFRGPAKVRVKGLAIGVELKRDPFALISDP